MRISGRKSLLALLFLCALTVESRIVEAAITADNALDVCSASADPCSITQTIEVVSGSILDFGTRTVQITGSGQIDVGGGTGRIRAGRFAVGVNGTGLKVSDGSAGGLLTIESYKKCSLDGNVRCMQDSTCAAVSAGLCSLGSGNVDLGGKTNGNAEDPGSLLIRAAGDITVSGRIQINGSTLFSDAGSLDLDAAGSIFVNASIETNSGGEGTGGEIVLSAGTDLRVGATIDALGGDFDGGTIEVYVGRDVLVTAGISASASTGEGYGGSIDVEAGRNFEVVGGTSLNNLTISTDGHTGFDGPTAFAGDGGVQTYLVGGAVSLGPFVRLRSNGASPDGSGDEISIESEGQVTVHGTLESKAKGTLGAGGLIELSSEDALTLSATSSVDVSGSEGGGGSVFAYGRGNLTTAGSIEVAASNSGLGGLVDLDTDQLLTVGGVIHNGGAKFGANVGQLKFYGCQITVSAGTSINNQSDGGKNSFFVADLLTVRAGASVLAPSDGKNSIQRRDASVLPLILGNVSPSATMSVNAALPSCPLCGNGAVNLGETCDDANTVGGDGCSSDCQFEACVSATPGYPGVPLCYDANPCTIDRCDPSLGGCLNLTSCDDGFGCTVDECVSGVCVHTAMNELCDDNNECTSQNCAATFGCTITGVSGLCDDEVYCNGSDACLAGACAQHTGNPCAGLPECLDVCNEDSDVCRAPFGYPCTTDGNACTDDVCSGVGGCLHVTNSAPCDDGVFCNGLDFCTGGACSFSLGNPCDAGSACAHTCDESANLCTAPAGDACVDDANPCTDDVCDGLGGCDHAPSNAPCDDGDLCTVTDVCSASACVAIDRVEFAKVGVSAQRKAGVNDDRVSFKATASLAEMSANPTADGLTLLLHDGTGAELLSAHLPATAIVDSGGRGTTFKFRDRKGLYPTANGVVSATMKHVANSGQARVNVKARGLDLPPLLGIGEVAVSLLVGPDPVGGDCVSERSLPCSASASKLRCRN